jgi:pimeloyl-ACP methyl ester carboxylesterase
MIARSVPLLLASALCALAQPFQPSIPDTIRIPSWRAVGPFSVGPRENAIDELVEHGGEDSIRPMEGMAHSSWLVPGGIVRWRRVGLDSDGTVKLNYDSLSWDTLAQSYGNAALFSVSYAYAEFESDRDARALVIADGAASFRLNGVVWPGDQYKQKFVRVAVPIRRGTNRVLVRQTGYAGGSFTFLVTPAPNLIEIVDRDATLPDAIALESLDEWVGLPFLNTTNVRARALHIVFGDGSRTTMYDTSIHNLDPFCIRKVPLRLRSIGPIEAGETLRVPVSVEWDTNRTETILTLRTRAASEAHKVTFRSSIDASVQYYGVLPPSNPDPARLPGLILSLHGASVEASGLAEAYRAKPWAYVVAPTNRRPFGFDWQDWGARDALEVLTQARERFSIDTNRVWLAGHSMGGHGTWSVGLHHPDRFAAIAPSAGWTSFPLYIPWTLQRSAAFAEPEILAARDRALRHDDELLFAENATSLPAYILHGGSDDNVPPVHGRMFAEELRRLGDSVQFVEVPWMGHWWDRKETPGIDCIDDSSMMAFLESHRRDAWPKHVRFRTVDLGQSSSADWVGIDEVQVPFRDALIDARVDGNHVIVATENIGEFTLHLSGELIHEGEIVLVVDGREIPIEVKERDTLHLTRTADRFTLARRAHRAMRKRPDEFGPMKQATFTPFVMVYGTAGDSAMNELLLHKARVQSFIWWRIGNGLVDVVADSEVTGTMMHARNLLLFGGSEANRITRTLSPSFPIVLDSSSTSIGGRIISGDHLAAQFVYPNPLAPEKLVLVQEGSDLESEALAGAFGLFFAASGLPDYMIYDASVRRKGWGGVRAAGFFDNNWRVGKQE